LRQDGQCCGREAQCGRRTKINWTKTAHNTRICICTCGHLGLVPIHTHTHTPLCGYGLSTGPTDGLSSWWLRNLSPPTANNNNNNNNDSISSDHKPVITVFKNLYPKCSQLVDEPPAVSRDVSDWSRADSYCIAMLIHTS